jgi:predicted DNA-binding ribbon-helix-helix protein
MACSSKPFQHPVKLHSRAICLSLEPPLWEAFNQLAARRRLTLSQLLEQIDCESGHFRPCPSKSSLVRAYLVADLLRRVR